MVTRLGMDAELLLSSLQGTIEMGRNTDFIYSSHSFAKSLLGAS